MMVNKIDRQDKIWIGRRFSDSLVDCVAPAAGTELLSPDISSITTRIIVPSSSSHQKPCWTFSVSQCLIPKRRFPVSAEKSS